MLLTTLELPSEWKLFPGKPYSEHTPWNQKKLVMFIRFNRFPLSRTSITTQCFQFLVKETQRGIMTHSNWKNISKSLNCHNKGPVQISCDGKASDIDLNYQAGLYRTCHIWTYNVSMWPSRCGWTQIPISHNGFNVCGVWFRFDRCEFFLNYSSNQVVWTRWRNVSWPWPM